MPPRLPTFLRERLEREQIDPLASRIGRVLRVAQATGLGEGFGGTSARELIRLVARNGLNVRVLHKLGTLLHPDRVALSDGERSVTYAQAEKEIGRLANALRDRLGVGAGVSVMLATENRVEYLLTWFALLRLGARAAHTSYRLTPAELEYQVRHARAQVLLVSGESIGVARQVREAVGSSGPRLVVCGWPSDASRDEFAYSDLVATGRDEPLPAPSKNAGGSVVYTSGTTGKPKGAVRDFLSFGPGELARILEHLPFRAGEKHAVVAPLYHSAPQAFAILVTCLGGTIHLLPHFDAESTLRVLSEQGATSVFLVPTMLRRILELPADALGRWPVPMLRAIVVGASEFPQALREVAIARFGPEVLFDFYGATELGWVTLIRGDEMLQRPGSVGKPLAGQRISVIDEEGREVPTGKVGKIYVRNDQTMAGYLDDPAASSATRRGASVTVDDLGRVDADGYLYLVGRARDMVKSGGVNLYPAEIEDALHRDPAIQEVAVIGVRDPEWGESLVAIVVPRGLPFDAKAAEQRARQQLSSTKVPRRWEVVTELPRNATGKVLKTELRARFSA